ncbi:MAG: hypothetical protein ACFHWX_18185 [Bacteroidota bacterium]
MKKLIFNVCGAAIVAAALMFNIQANRADADSVSLMESVQIEAIAGSGNCYRKMEHNCSWGITIVCRSNANPANGACKGTEDCDYC